MNSIAEVESFTDKIAETGKWNGEAVEGFVVRTHVMEPVDQSSGASPYPAGSTLFFKVKFDEPYMMYRDWREITKMLLSSKGPLNQSRVSATRMKRPETRLYVKWVIKEIQTDRKPFEEYTKGKGIISTREKFLDWLASDEGKGRMENTKTDTGHDLDETAFGKTIIVPVAVPGSGAFNLK
jgi:tRNA ligase